jgi:uncharacterized repeat protein (TIGR03803 family)
MREVGLPTTVRGVYLLLYLVMDLWSRRIVDWRVADSAAIAAELITQVLEVAVIYSFGVGTNGTADGVFPEAGLIQGSDGNFYGTTANGGSYESGTVFEITPAGQETPIYSFASSTNSLDGVSPRAALIQGNDGNFYGTTVAGASTTRALCSKSRPPV